MLENGFPLLSSFYVKCVTRCNFSGKYSVASTVISIIIIIKYISESPGKIDFLSIKHVYMFYKFVDVNVLNHCFQHFYIQVSLKYPKLYKYQELISTHPQ